MKQEIKTQLQKAIEESLLTNTKLVNESLNWTDRRYVLSHIFERTLSESDLGEIGLKIWDLVDIVEERPSDSLDWMAAGDWDSKRQKLEDQGIIFNLPIAR
jgi:hypothetical protein